MIKTIPNTLDVQCVNGPEFSDKVQGELITKYSNDVVKPGYFVNM